MSNEFIRHSCSLAAVKRYNAAASYGCTNFATDAAGRFGFPRDRRVPADTRVADAGRRVRGNVRGRASPDLERLAGQGPPAVSVAQDAATGDGQRAARRGALV